jgi:hypothetical protein
MPSLRIERQRLRFILYTNQLIKRVEAPDDAEAPESRTSRRKQEKYWFGSKVEKEPKQMTRDLLEKRINAEEEGH